MSPTATVFTPSPLPTEIWVNQTTINYDNLFRTHSADIICLNRFIPVGVLGFYIWFGYQLVTIWSLVGWLRRPPKDDSGRVRSIIFSVLMCVFSIVMLIQNLKVVFRCGITGMGKYAVPALFITVVSCWEVPISILCGGKQRTFLGVVPGIIAVAILALALFLQQLSGLVYFVGVLRLRMELRTVQFWDTVRLDATLLALAPSICLAILLLFVLIFAPCLKKVDERESRMSRRSCWRFIIPNTIQHLFKASLIILGFLYCAFLALLAVSEVMMGKIIGDPYGKLFLKQLIGGIDLAMAVGFPTSQAALYFLYPAGA